MILRSTVRAGEPMLLTHKLYDQAQAVKSQYCMAFWQHITSVGASFKQRQSGLAGPFQVLGILVAPASCDVVSAVQPRLQQEVHTMCWHMRSHLVDGAGLPPSRGVLSALLSGEPAAALLAFIHSMVPWEALALSASPSVSSTARSAVSRMLAASVSPTVPFLTVVQTTGVSHRLCAGHHDYVYGFGAVACKYVTVGPPNEYQCAVILSLQAHAL